MINAASLPRPQWLHRRSVFGGAALLCVAAWFYSFPLVESFTPLDIALDATVLATTLAAWVYVRTLRYLALELAWKVLIFGHLICLLDCFTSESRTASTAIAVATYLSETITIVAILWGVHRYRQRREKHSRRLRRLRMKRNQTEQRYAELVNAVDGIVWEADPETFKFTFVSKRAERLLGYPLSQWYAEPNFWANHIAPEDRERTVRYCIEESRLRRAHQFEYRMMAADGRVVWLRDLVNSVQTPDGVWRLCGVMFVVTETKRLEERLRYSATHDALTGLPNREIFLSRLREIHAISAKNPAYAILFLDIDRFKMVNDTLGHHHGDRLIVELASRLRSFAGDGGMIARLGGDEFAFLAESVRDGVEAVGIAAKLQAAIKQPVHIAGRVVEPSASVGIALGRASCGDVQELLQDADTAMYQAKSRQRGSYQIFDLEMRRALLRQVHLESDLKRGFRANEFRIFFQPIVDLPSGRADGFEALTRWIHPERGVVAAGDFMHLALEMDVGAEMAWNAIDLTFQQAKAWERRFPGACRLSSNISEIQFIQPDFLQRMEALLASSGADPRNLTLEITEDIATEDTVTERKLRELKRMGFTIALDDFGVGRSSLNRLCQLPIDVIKIDRSFIQSMHLGDSEVLIRAISTVADDLGMEVVAEGIETEAQRSRLLRMGFRLGQGFLFDRALPLEEAERWLPANLPTVVATRARFA